MYDQKNRPHPSFDRSAVPASMEVMSDHETKRRRVANDVIEVNVGGKIFTTRKSTLQFEKDSMLAKLFDDDSPFGEVTLDSHERVFLDRDPEMFSVVIDYLRCAGRLVGATSCSLDELAKVKEQAEFFSLAGLCAAVDEIVRLREAAEAEAARPKIMEYELRRLGLPSEADQFRLTARSRKQQLAQEVQRLANIGYRVSHMQADHEAGLIDVLMAREAQGIAPTSQA